MILLLNVSVRKVSSFSAVQMILVDMNFGVFSSTVAPMLLTGSAAGAGTVLAGVLAVVFSWVAIVLLYQF